MASLSPAILPLSIINEHLVAINLIEIIEQAFVSYSSGLTVIPPVGELIFPDPPGDVHIKYGYIKNAPYYVVKIASGFYENKKLGISNSQGLMLLFSQYTGELLAILLDEGHLTNVRTAIASMITLKHLAPVKVDCIGIVGAGIQAKLQLAHLDQVCSCKKVMVWSQSPSSSNSFQEYFIDTNFQIDIANSITDIAEACHVIITTTPSHIPLLLSDHIRRGTHITAIGSDTSDKVELEPELIKRSDVVVVDSIAQSHSRGEVYRARIDKCLDENKLIELGNLIQKTSLGRISEDQITIADLTGLAVQDISIATAIYNQYKTHLL